MKINFLHEISISLVLIILLVLFLNPFNFWMPSVLLVMMVLALIVGFSIFAIFIWKENTHDEREDFHKVIAARVSFLAGATVLVVGIIAQTFAHKLDFYLVLTLSVMVLAKIGGLIYSRMRH